MTQEKYNFLYEKFESGACSDKEIEELLAFEDDFAMSDQEWQIVMGDKKLTRERIFNKLSGNIRQTPKLKTRNYKIIFAIAAAFLLFVSISLILFFPKNQFSNHISKLKNSNSILPGKDQAILKMADGSKVVLDKIKIGESLKYGNLSVTKTSSGEIIYAANTNLTDENEGGFNEITTPKGGQFSIVLEDGSKVWLNASSSLRFPKKFAAQQRKVELKGEAYFEISKNANRPFYVAANNATVKVLGTHFNISNYVEDNFTKTTLLEGSVEMTALGSKEMLVPNQEALYLNNSKKIEVKNAPYAQDAIAWKEGVFMFRDENIQSIMQKISRWYDVDVVYNKEALNEQFSGSISKYQNIDKVLKQLQLTGSLNFKVEGRRVYVMK
jgi:transmembrane sensor